MFSTAPARPPRRLLILIVTVTVVPLAVLSWLGWRLLEQDRALEAEQIRQRVDQGADRIVSSLQQALLASEQRLASGVNSWPDGEVAVIFRDGQVDASPRDRVAFLPTVIPLREPPTAPFADGEALEFRRRDSDAAIHVYRELATSPDSAIRAGALLRLGRVLRQTGRVDEALATYASLSEIDSVAIGGVPAALIGRYARCRVLESENRQSELLHESQKLHKALSSGRWNLSQPVYALYASDARKWSGEAGGDSREAELLAEAIDRLWDRWTTTFGQPQGTSGRESLTIDDSAVVVLWQQSGPELRALFVTPRGAESEWFATLPAIAGEHGISFGIRDLNSMRFGTTPSGATTTRTVVDSGLPWTVVAASLDPPLEQLAFARRQRLLTVGFLLLVSLALVAGYSIARAIGREMAVARMQSDFVSAVSHEFRTPLTALRQFTDMLREHPVLDDERRRIAYDAQSRATDRLSRLVESLLDFRRMEEGAHRYELAPRDANEFVRRVVDDFRTHAKTAGFDVHLHSNGASTINVDDEALGRAVWNLLDNAVKYSPTPSPIDVMVAERNGHVLISVRDHGIGIPKHEQAAVFSKFYRGDEARAAGIKGTGIGLAMVQQIVGAHGGRVELDSVQGHGSTFTIVLPGRR